MLLKRALLAATAVAVFASPRASAALSVDFDASLIQIQLYLGNAVTLRNVDGDSNGLKEDDQLGMLGILLGGGAPTSCITPTRVSTVQNAYTANVNELANQASLNVTGLGTVDFFAELQAAEPGLGDALRALLAGLITIGDPECIDYANTLADEAIAQWLLGTPQEDQTQNAQDQLTLLAADFQPLGAAGAAQNLLGAAGDIDNDLSGNLAEYTALLDKTRENWLTACCIMPTLRIVNYSGGGTKVTGLTLNFSVSTAGEAGPVTSSWFKGQPGSGTLAANAATYSIPFASTTDTGTYYAVVSDGVNTRTTPPLSLSVAYVPLSITQPITGGTLFEGASKSFSVGVQGGQPGPYVFTWKKGANIVGTNAPTYTIPVLNTGDTGQYSVSVTSNGGDDTVTSGPVTLTVNPVDGLTIATQPASGSRALGESYTFSVLVIGGFGNYTYTWRKNGQALGAPSQASLVLNNLTGANAGVYSCVVLDNVDQSTVTSQNATLNVTGGLTVTTQPLGATINPHANYTLTIAVTGGSGTYDYAWYQDGNLIDVPSAPSYSITDADGSDTGDYTCFVSDVNNGALSVLSNVATVVVSLGGLSITQQPESGTHFVGENLQLSVAVSGGSSVYSYDWRKDNVSLGAPSSPTLSLNSITLDDTGSYRCRIEDAQQGGSVFVLSNIAVINVIDTSPITFDAQPQSGLAYTGNAYTFSVNVFGGSGSYNYAWTKNGDPVCDCNAPSFTISSVTFADAGDYQCVVTDLVYTDLAATSETATLQVGADLVVQQQPAGGNFIAGQSYALTAVVTGGIGFVSYSWEHDGEAVPNAPNAPTLDLGVVRLVEAGEYRCTISDAYHQIHTDIATINVSLMDVPTGQLDYNLQLKGSNCVPPVITAASGNAVGSLTRNGANPALGATLSYSTVQSVVDAQYLIIFAGANNVNGEFLLVIGPGLDAQSGSIQVTQEEMSIIYAGYAYFGVTSEAYPTSEIRGQIALGYTPPASTHGADQNNDNIIQLSELLRVIQFYNSFEYHCSIDGEDGFAPGPGNRDCEFHNSDYNPPDWSISLQELLRLIQFYNSFGYHACDDPNSEDGFCAGPLVK